MDDFEDPVAKTARERFGIAGLHPYQRLVAANVLDASAPGAERLRQMVILPTGFGKSLCFQLPALLLPGTTLVVYPLLALMSDQRRRLDSIGIGSALLRGGMSAHEVRAEEARVERGEARIIIANPEVLRGSRALAFLKEAGLSHIAVDEAHCVSEWGESFRPAYLELGRIVEELAPPALSAFTATASPSVLESVTRILFRGEGYILVEGYPDRPNIHYAVTRTLCRERRLLALVRELPKPLVVFCSSREGAQMASRLLLERLGRSELRFYHAGLRRDEKEEVERWFMPSKDGILCSTCAFGLGVDKKDIRSVIHFQPPPSVEAYLQEAGRAGRDGLPASAVLISSPADADRLERETEGQRRERYRALLDYAESDRGCRREALLDLLGAPREGRTPCSGCDRCDGSPNALAEGEAELRLFASANARRFSRDEALDLLKGRTPSRLSGQRCAYWGALADWDAKDASRCLDEAIRRGVIGIGRAWPWKGLIGPARRLYGSSGPGAGAGVLGAAREAVPRIAARGRRRR
jgi:ATP-dependent DNA helicase RecQ